MEPKLVEEAGSADGVEDEAAAAAEEEELARWAAAAGEASSAGAEAPLVEDVADESSSEEEAEAVDPSAPARERVLRRAILASRSAPPRPRGSQNLWRNPSSVNPENMDAIIEDVAKAAEVDAEKIAAEAAAKGVAEDAAEGPAGEADKATTEEAGKGPVEGFGKAAVEEEEEVADDQPSSSAGPGFGKYLRRHREALDAQALVHASKVKELEVERDRLKDQTLKLAEEKDTLNAALTEAQGAVLGKAEQLSKANDSVKDLKLKLEALEGMFSGAKAREGTLAKELETEKQLRKVEAATHKDFVDGQNRWIGRLEDVAVVLGALEQLKSNWESSLADESRLICRGAMTKVLTKLAFWNPDLDFDAALDSLPGDADLSGIEERIEPVISRFGGILRVEGQRRE
nr:myosin heavy chain, embryonic smooth muscle isoform-like [Aegilops tauschii subsp. strangulata]